MAESRGDDATAELAERVAAKERAAATWDAAADTALSTRRLAG